MDMYRLSEVTGPAEIQSPASRSLNFLNEPQGYSQSFEDRQRYVCHFSIHTGPESKSPVAYSHTELDCIVRNVRLRMHIHVTALCSSYFRRSESRSPSPTESDMNSRNRFMVRQAG